MRTSEDNPQDWFLLAADRLSIADLARRHKGVTFAGVELLQEAVERYLKGYLVAQGWELGRTHDLAKLIEAATHYDDRFSGYVVQTDVPGEPMLIIAPVTSNLAALRFAFSVRVEPSPENGLTSPSVVMIFQMRAIDKTRIVRKIGQLSPEDMARIDAEIWSILRPPDSDA
jgi:mRNA interferase MazF